MNVYYGKRGLRRGRFVVCSNNIGGGIQCRYNGEVDHFSSKKVRIMVLTRGSSLLMPHHVRFPSLVGSDGTVSSRPTTHQLVQKWPT